MNLKNPYPYSAAPYGIITTIPAGAELSPAENLPKSKDSAQFWVKPWEGMNEMERGWWGVYGFLVEFQIPKRGQAYKVKGKELPLVILRVDTRDGIFAWQNEKLLPISCEAWHYWMESKALILLDSPQS